MPEASTRIGFCELVQELAATKSLLVTLGARGVRSLAFPRRLNPGQPAHGSTIAYQFLLIEVTNGDCITLTGLRIDFTLSPSSQSRTYRGRREKRLSVLDTASWFTSRPNTVTADAEERSDNPGPPGGRVPDRVQDTAVAAAVQGALRADLRGRTSPEPRLRSAGRSAIEEFRFVFDSGDPVAEGRSAQSSCWRTTPLTSATAASRARFWFCGR
jgi:hypothetical protein